MGSGKFHMHGLPPAGRMEYARFPKNRAPADLSFCVNLPLGSFLKKFCGVLYKDIDFWEQSVIMNILSGTCAR